MLVGGSAAQGWDALRRAVALAMCGDPVPLAPAPTGPAGWLSSTATDGTPTTGRPDGPGRGRGSGPDAGHDDAALATSSEESSPERDRLIALVELARSGDAEAFGLLYDHYQPQVYRFLYYRTRSVPLAEDLTAETFFRALRRMADFRWQGKDFGAWLMTIARNLCTDHFKSSRARLELTTDDMARHDDATESLESEVMAGLTKQALLDALAELPDEQRDCVVMRFLQGLSIAETALALGRSSGAVKQLQLRGVRNLAKLMPEGARE